jgi:DDE superfamily endonuclease
MGGRLLEGRPWVDTTSKWEDELERWLEPFLDRLGHKARRRMCPLYVLGLIGPGDRKSVQPMPARLAPGDYDQLHQDAPVVNTGNAARLVRKERPDGNPFKVRQFIPHDSRLPFERLNHVQTDAFNRQNRTTGISEITP